MASHTNRVRRGSRPTRNRLSSRVVKRSPVAVAAQRAVLSARLLGASPPYVSRRALFFPSWCVVPFFLTKTQSRGTTSSWEKEKRSDNGGGAGAHPSAACAGDQAEATSLRAEGEGTRSGGRRTGPYCFMLSSFLLTHTFSLVPQQSAICETTYPPPFPPPSPVSSVVESPL